jgi:G6PDH family F420-dependent oxidoreductase
MADFGYTMLCEQTPPRQLVADLVRAEAAGFDFSVISDHYFPWIERQGHAAYAWSVLGAASQATERISLMTFVTCPTFRYHPAVVAQKAATMGVLSQGRFTLGLGAGENLNEHVVGRGWPSTWVRHEMLTEAVEIIQKLFEGGRVEYHGEFFDVDDAKIYDLPDEPVPIAMAASGGRSLRLAAEYADGLVSLEPKADLVARFDETAGPGKPKYTQIPISYGPDPEEALRRASELWSWGVGGWALLSELPGPRNFEAHARYVRPEDIAELVTIGDDIGTYQAAVGRFTDAGFTHIAFCQLGADRQADFIRWAETELLPALR